MLSIDDLAYSTVHLLVQAADGAKIQPETLKFAKRPEETIQPPKTNFEAETILDTARSWFQQCHIEHPRCYLSDKLGWRKLPASGTLNTCLGFSFHGFWRLIAKLTILGRWGRDRRACHHLPSVPGRRTDPPLGPGRLLMDGPSSLSLRGPQAQPKAVLPCWLLNVAQSPCHQ